MARFEIKDDFYLDGKPFKILSGAIHYFRVPAEDWHHSLYNLKALGSIRLRLMLLGTCMNLLKVTLTLKVILI